MVNSDFYLGVQASLFQAIDRKSRQRLHIYKEEMNKNLDNLIDSKDISYPNDFEEIVHNFVVASHMERVKRSRNIQITQMVIGWLKKFPKSTLGECMNYVSPHIENEEEAKLAEEIFGIVLRKYVEENRKD